MQLYGGLKVNILPYSMFVYNTPCLGQQVKGHNASDATQNKSNLQTVSE